MATSRETVTRSERTIARIVRQIVIATIATALVLELGARIAAGSLLAWGPPEDRGRRGIVDPVLGHIPRGGLSIRVRDSFTITTSGHGTRSNGARSPGHNRPQTLVVGDSFAFGDEVDDDETWPAILEQLTARRVINAAVPGFGLDQAVLRAEQLAPIYEPDRLIVSFIPHDIRRCQMSIWSGNAKPYFDIDASGLVLRPPPTGSALQVQLASVLSRSVLVDTLFHDLLQRDGPDTLAHHRGGEVGCLLMDRLATLQSEFDVEVVVLAQPQTPLPNEPHYPDDGARPQHSDEELVSTVLACARQRGLRTLDLIPVVAALSPEHRERLFHGHGHNSPEGNRVIATELRAFLDRERRRGRAHAPSTADDGSASRHTERQ